MKSREDIVARLEALMKRTQENGASEAEVEAAMRVARKLMDEHNIEMAEILEAQQRQLNTSDIVDEEARAHCKLDRHEAALMWAVCYVCDCKWYFTTEYRNNERGKRVLQKVRHVVGTKTDVLAAKMLYIELLITVRFLARAKVGDGWSQAHYWYCNGFCEALREKCRADAEQSKATPAGQPGTGIILQKHTAIQQVLDGLALRTAKPSRVGGRGEFESDAYNTGRADGMAHKVHADRHTHVTTGSKKLN